MLLSRKVMDAAYLLFLNRSCDEDQIGSTFNATDDLVRHFLLSEEFDRRIVIPLCERETCASSGLYLPDEAKIELNKLFGKDSSLAATPAGHLSFLNGILPSFAERNAGLKTQSNIEIHDFVGALQKVSHTDEKNALRSFDLAQLARKASAIDVRQLYISLLGRTPESLAIERSKVDLPAIASAHDIFRSNEFEILVAGPVMAGKTICIDAPPQILEGSFLQAFKSVPDISQCTGREIVGLIMSLCDASSLPNYLLEFANVLNKPPAVSSFKYCRPGLNYFSSLTEEEITKDVERILDGRDFDPLFYKANNPVLAGRSDNELAAHYLVYGHELFHDPSPLISESRLSIARRSQGAALLTKDYKLPEFAADPDTSRLAEYEVKRGISFCSRYSLAAFEMSSEPLFLEATQALARRQTCFTTSGSTHVSIVIPVYGQLGYTLSSLDALSLQRFTFTAEIVIVDDCSPSAAQIDLLARIPWVRYIQTPKNLGFLGACNYAAEKTAGEIIVLLNSDTRVCDGWLKELVYPLDHDARVGLVGSKLYNDDYSLQEAGAIIWRDGTGHNYGRNSHHSEAAEYSYLRDVDYCSGAAIAVRNVDWRKLGGFDTRFTPAYYEDVDLAFAIKKIGLRVLVQPLAKVIHYEGKTHGTDETSGGKSFIRSNRLKLLEKWAEKLASHGKSGELVFRNIDKSKSRQVLIIDAEIPFPDRDAGSVLSMAIIHQLHHLGFQISYLPTHNTLFSAGYSDDLARLGVEVLYGVGNNIDLVRGRLSERSIELIIGFRWNVMDSIMQTLRSYFPDARMVFHTVDLHHMRLEREAALLGSWLVQSEAENAHDGEIRLLLEADCTIVTSMKEKEVLDSEVEDQPIVYYPFCLPKRASVGRRERQRSFVFVGGFRHTPNVDACLFLIDKLWPKVCEALDDQYKLVIVGPDAPPAIARSAAKNVVVLGHVRDLDAILDQSFAMIAPLRFGAGIKGKVLTALAGGLPVITSATAVEGTSLCGDRDLLLAASDDEYLRQIMRLIHEDGLWEQLRENGYRFVDENYSFEVGLKNLRSALDMADRTWRVRRRSQRQAFIERWMSNKSLVSSRPS